VNEQCVQCEVVKQTCLNFYTPLDIYTPLDMCPKSAQAKVPTKCPPKCPKSDQATESEGFYSRGKKEKKFQPCDHKVSQKCPRALSWYFLGHLAGTRAWSLLGHMSRGV